MSVINDIENSAYIQALKQEFAEAQAAGASQEQLLAIHAKAQDYRQANGYTANLDGSQFTVIERYEPVSAPVAVQQVNTNKPTSDSNGSVAGSGAQLINTDSGEALKIGNGNISQYIKFAVVGLVGLTFIDIVFGGGK